MLAFVESVFEAYFVQGRNIGDASVLQALADAAALPWNAASFNPAQYPSTMAQAGGVPQLVFNQRLQVTGAVPPSDLLRAMEQAHAA